MKGDTNKPSYPITGRYDQRYWHIGEDHNLLLYTERGKPEEQENRLVKNSRVNIFSMNTFLNMGVSFLESGSIRWDGDEFSAISTNYGFTGLIHGKLNRDTQGRAASMILDNVFVLADGLIHSNRWEETYSYETNIGIAFLPNRLSRELIDPDGQRRLVSEITIISMATNKVPLGRVDFEPGAFTISNETKTFMVLGDALIREEFDKSGRLQNLRKVVDFSKPPPPVPKGLRIEYHNLAREAWIKRLILLLMVLSPVIVYLATRTGGRKNTPLGQKE